MAFHATRAVFITRTGLVYEAFLSRLPDELVVPVIEGVEFIAADTIIPQPNTPEWDAANPTAARLFTRDQEAVVYREAP